VNYIKRLIGLPNEDLRIIEGRIYVCGTDPAAPEAVRQWHIARSTRRDDGTPTTRAQQAVWQPVYHSQYIPLDYQGDGSGATRWGWRTPWRPAGALVDAWRVDQQRAYCFAGPGTGAIHFDFDGQIVARDDNGMRRSVLFAYNQLSEPVYGRRRLADERDPLEDVRLAAGFKPDGPGLAVRLQTEARWALHTPGGGAWQAVNGGRPTVLAAVVAADGTAHLELSNVPDPTSGRAFTVLASGDAGPFVPGRSRQVELWNVDQEASLWVDGRQVAVAEFDLDIDQVISRPPLPNGFLPQIGIQVSGTPVTLERVEVDRNIFYQSTGREGTARGAVAKSGEGPPVVRTLHLGPDEFFCLGDNSPSSSDGRFWNDIDPWVLTYMMPGRTREESMGIVPREAMMGRAFFVYWPGMYGMAPDSRVQLIPNFGEMRFIH
jgi:hypothetical protein